MVYYFPQQAVANIKRKILVFFLFFITLLLIYFCGPGSLLLCVGFLWSRQVVGLLFLAVHRLLIVVASLVAEHGLYVWELSSCSIRA